MSTSGIRKGYNVAQAQNVALHQSIQETAVIARSEATWQSRGAKKYQRFRNFVFRNDRCRSRPAGELLFCADKKVTKKSAPGFRRPTGTLRFSSVRALAFSDDRYRESGISKKADRAKRDEIFTDT